jgi:hypothetical protein
MGVPMDLIEYPIDKKNSDKEYNQSLLGLDSEYKHVLNIGLFTWGKNQGYAFEIARLLQDYKIKFHFVGNQASNFVDYWGPIMETKPDNCIVWGERNDVDSFTQACDIHLFTSRLELNPLSIKESLEYSKPTMIFNLPPYKGKYDGEDGIIYLTGDTIKDSRNVLKILGIEIEEVKNPKIRVVHLLMDPDSPEDIPLVKWNSTVLKQEFSISCWENMKDVFFDYVPRYTKVNRTELPYDNCMDPEILNSSKELENKPPVLTYGHYGAYKAHTQGILENFTDDIDALIIAEGDSFTNLAPQDFYNKIIESFNMSQILGTKIISYAGPYHISGIDWWGMTTKIGDWLKAPHFLLGTTYMIMKSEKDDIINCINNVPWHSPDFWLGWICHDRIEVLVSKEPIVYQKEGYSVLDYIEK